MKTMKNNNLIFKFFILTAILFSTAGYAQTITIGSQVWTTTNLNVSTYRNGDIIPQVQDPNAWSNLTTGAWCYHDNDPSNGTKYGKLYNWYAVKDPRGLAPNGFHIPTDAEWTKLTDYLGGEDLAGTKMKSLRGWKRISGGSIRCSNCSSWNSEYRTKVPCHTCKDTRAISLPTVSGSGSNSSGFSGLPGDYRIFYGVFFDLDGCTGEWWSCSESSEKEAWSRGLNCNNGNVDRTRNYKRGGSSVRCLRDNTIQTEDDDEEGVLN
jgi:uncharacterized protein (TIGR02145 family)